LSLFDILVYRGKEFGIIHATEFYPGFSGRVVFPTSVVLPGSNGADFEELYRYAADNMGLYSHKPKAKKVQNHFVDFLVEGYLFLRRTHRSLFCQRLGPPRAGLLQHENLGGCVRVTA